MFSVGKICKPQGIKGEVKVEILTSFPEHFNELQTVYIENDDFQAYSIERVRMSNRFVFLKFKGVDTRDEAETLRSHYLYIEEKQLTELGSGEYYIHDLIGIKVFSEEHSYIGEIVDVESYAANDVYLVKDEMAREYMIPAITDVVLNIDVDKKTMTIRVIDGLLD